MTSKWMRSVHDVRRAAFQIDGELLIFRHVHDEESGVTQYITEKYSGDPIESEDNPTDSFAGYVANRVADVLETKA